MSTSEIKARNGVSASGVIGRDTYNHHALSKYDMGLEVGQPTITESKVQVAVCPILNNSSTTLISDNMKELSSY